MSKNNCRCNGKKNHKKPSSSFRPNFKTMNLETKLETLKKGIGSWHKNLQVLVNQTTKDIGEMNPKLFINNIDVFKKYLKPENQLPSKVTKAIKNKHDSIINDPKVDPKIKEIVKKKIMLK